MSLSATSELFLGAGPSPVNLALRFANRHGLIAGATGTGKTVSLQIMAEGFSNAGVPVFMADVKGDLAGLAQPGVPKSFLLERAQKIGLTDYAFTAFPVTFWDLYGEAGHPVRTTLSEMGPLLLARMLGLNDVQEGVLNLAFKVADDQGLLVLDMNDLRSLLTFVAKEAASLTTTYGNVSAASVGSIQRRLLELDAQGADRFFGEPALQLQDFMRTGPDGRGMINILAAHRLIEAPKLYATFLLWLLSELFEELPEVGDLDRPRLVFFFDEAHLLFADAPKALMDKVTQVVRLIRSKGVGVYFVTQNPLDVPEAVLGQLGNRIQHALRAYTPRDQKAVRAAAQTFRPNPAINTEQAITELGVGEALVSTLDAKGAPTPVERVLIRPPCARLGAISPEERQALLNASPLAGKYTQTIDRISAHEMLKDRAAREMMAAPSPSSGRASGRTVPDSTPIDRPQRSPARRSDTTGEAMVKSVVRSIGSTLGRELVRGILGSLRRR